MIRASSRLLSLLLCFPLFASVVLGVEDEEADIGYRIALCGVWYYIWISVLPKWRVYEHRQTVEEFDDGTVTHKIVKVPTVDIPGWDSEHDDTGRLHRRVAREST